MWTELHWTDEFLDLLLNDVYFHIGKPYFSISNFFPGCLPVFFRFHWSVWLEEVMSMRFLFFLIKKFVSPLFIPVIGKNYHFIHCFHSLIFFFESDKCFSWLKMRVLVTWCHCCRQHCYLKTQLL